MTKEFNEWMAKIGNIYYANDNSMARAFNIIEQNEEVTDLSKDSEKKEMLGGKNKKTRKARY